MRSGGDLRVRLGFWRAACWLWCPGVGGREESGKGPRDQPEAAEGPTASRDTEGQGGVLGERGWRLSRKVGANPAPNAEPQKS